MDGGSQNRAFSDRLSDRTASELSFIEILLTIIIAWILVALWQRVLDNLSFSTLRLDSKSTYHTFIIALFVTSMFIALSFTVSNLIDSVIIGAEEQDQFFGDVQGPVRRTVDEVDNDNPVDEANNIIRKNTVPLKVDLVDSQNYKYGPFINKRTCLKDSDRKCSRRKRRISRRLTRRFHDW